MCVDVLKANISTLNTLLDQVIVHFDMLHVRVEHRASSHMDTVHVVVVKGNQIFDGDI